MERIFQTLTFLGCWAKEITNTGARDTPVVVHPRIPVTSDVAWGSQEGCACLVALCAQNTTRHPGIHNDELLSTGFRESLQAALPPTAAPHRKLSLHYRKVFLPQRKACFPHRKVRFSHEGVFFPQEVQSPPPQEVCFLQKEYNVPKVTCVSFT